MGAEVLFRRRLRELIKLRYGSMDRMYLETGISKGHIGALVSGKYSPTLATIEKFAKALDVEVVDFFLPEPQSSKK